MRRKQTHPSSGSPWLPPCCGQGPWGDCSPGAQPAKSGRALFFSFLAIWLFGLLAIGSCARRMNTYEKERTTIIQELQQSLQEVKKLSGLLPICCSCKSIRDDKGYWKEVEKYMGEHADVQFTHGICPDCARKLYPELYDGDGQGPGQLSLRRKSA